MLWTGRVLSGLVILFLLMGGVIGLMKIPENVEKFKQYGYPAESGTWIPVTLLTCTLLYAIPRTAILGAILLTGYLGGATATHVRAGEPFFFPIVVGVVAWLGLFLRDSRLRSLLLNP